MIRLRTTSEGLFIPLSTQGESLSSIHVVITDEGELSRNYYGPKGTLLCWSSGADIPDKSVAPTNKQSTRCVDCVQNIKGPTGHRTKSCKFFTLIALVLDECKTMCSLRVNGGSLFGKSESAMALYGYRDYLQRNGEKLHTVLTEIYFKKTNGFNKMYFKPVRPLTGEEVDATTQLIQADETNNNLFKNLEESLSMKNQTYLLKDVKARYPRINQPYCFDDKAGENGKTVPCDAMEDGAKYEMEFVLADTQAKHLYKAMSEAYKAAKTESWPAKLTMPFKQQEDGSYVGKTNLKAAYNGRATGSPAQFDADNKPLEKDFQLTTGSTINLALELVPYKMAACGVSLRLRGVQVIDYAPLQSVSPFEAQEGFTGVSEENTEDAEDMFGVVEEEVVAEIKEPVKRKSKKTEAAPVLEADAFSDAIAEWGSEGA